MLGSNDRFYTSETLRGVRHGTYRPFRLVWPAHVSSCPDCSFDQFTQSGDNVTCQSCKGTGKVFTWTTAEVYGRIQHYDFVTLSAAGVHPGVEIGDVVVYVSGDVKDMIADKVRSDQYGYVFVDSDTYRPISFGPTGVGHIDEWRIELKRTEMDVRVSGY